MLRLKLKDVQAFEDFFFGLNVDKDLIYGNIFSTIQKGIFNNEKSVQFAHVTFENGEEIHLDCTIEDWKTNLENCINYYLEVEDYERCAQIDKLIKRINE